MARSSVEPSSVPVHSVGDGTNTHHAQDEQKQQQQQQHQALLSSQLGEPSQLLNDDHNITTSLPTKALSPPLGRLPILSALRNHEPIEIYFYNRLSGIWLANSQSKPLHYIRTISGGKPSLTMYADADPDSAVIAAVNYHFFSSKTDLFIMLLPPAVTAMTTTTAAAKPAQKPKPKPEPEPASTRTVMTNISQLQASWRIPLLVSSTGTKENFLWKHSAGREVGTLGLSHNGFKLVRESTMKVVAAYAKDARWSSKTGGKMGAFRWMGEINGDEYFNGSCEEAEEEECALVFVMSLVALVERCRRNDEYDVNA